MFTIRTIKQGARVAVWDVRGRVRYVDGPRRLLLFRKAVQQLSRHSAGADEYVAIDQQQAGFLREIREMQVDLTRYLVAQYQHPDRLIRISGDNGAQLHLHEDN